MRINRFAISLGVAIGLCILPNLSAVSQEVSDDINPSCAVPTSTMMQRDFDIARLSDLVHLAGALEEYRSTTGRIALANSASAPTYVFIATREQSQYVNETPPYEHTIRDVTDLKAELERVLGRAVEMPFDPQRVPDSKPNFYIYMAIEEYYSLSVHLHEPFSFAKRIANCYHKLDVTSFPDPPAGAWNLSDLLQDQDYISVSERTPNKPGYVEALRTQIREDGAF
jgi:hypothetical protein